MKKKELNYIIDLLMNTTLFHDKELRVHEQFHNFIFPTFTGHLKAT